MPPDRVQATASRAWQVTDDALTALAACLLGRPPEHRPPGGRPPERGAALLGPSGHPLITQVLPDPEPGTPVHYTHSPALRELLTAVLARRGDLAYRGTAHSHPGAMAEPSRQDLAAFRAVRAANPHLSPAPAFPIAVAALTPTLTDVTQAWGSDHLVALPEGTLATYTLSADRQRAVPVALSTLPVHAVATALRAGREFGCREAGSVREPSTGAIWLRHLLHPDDAPGQAPISVLINPGYPWVAPLLAVGPEPFWSPAWDLGMTPEQRLALAADALRERCRG